MQAVIAVTGKRERRHGLSDSKVVVCSAEAWRYPRSPVSIDPWESQCEPRGVAERGYVSWNAADSGSEVKRAEARDWCLNCRHLNLITESDLTSLEEVDIQSAWAQTNGGCSVAVSSRLPLHFWVLSRCVGLPDKGEAVLARIRRLVQ